jgi:hypothetical protein
MRRSLLPGLGLGLVLAGCATAPVAARSGTSVLEIHVTDPADEHARGGVPVVVQSSGLGGRLELVTGGDGRVRVERLPAGIYELRTPDGVRVVAGVGEGQRARVTMRSSWERIIVCYGAPSDGITRSLLDDDAASEFRHEPRVVHRLP